jgi:hypothetical protein
MSRLRPRSSIIASAHVQHCGAPLVIGQEDCRPGETDVQLVREGDQVTEIHVRCRCGEKIVLQIDGRPAPAGQR